jgi:hypothetical protein
MKRLITLIFFLLGIAGSAWTQIYLSESFEVAWSGTPAAPSGWTQTMIAAGSGSGSAINWAQNTWSGSAWSIACHGSPTGAQNGSSVAWFDDYNCMAGRIMRLETGNIDLLTSSNPRISFYFAANSGSTFTLKLRASNDGGGTWSDIQTISKPGTTWTKTTIVITAGYKVANARFAFEVTGAYGSYDAFLDNIVVDEIPAPLTGTKTIKSSGGDYSTFTAAINALNDAGVSGGVTFNVDDDLVFTEDPPAITATGALGNTIVFQRTGTGANRPVIKPTGTAGSNDFGICISGGDYITFDGIDITINTGSAVEYGYIVRNASATNGAQNNVIKNTKITLNRTNTTSKGILQTASSSYGGGVSPSSDAGTNSTNKYYNITVENAYQGIWLYGNFSYYDASCEIGVTGGGTTTIGASSANDIGYGSSATTYGIYTYYQKDHSIFNTEVRNVTSTGSYNAFGISVDYAQGTSSLYNNKVHDIAFTGTSTTYQANGIHAGAGSSQTLNVYNNVLYNILHGITSASATQVVRGIYANFNGTGTVNFYFNSVRIAEDANASTTCFYGYAGTIVVKNNIFANFSTAGATSKRYCWYQSSGTVTSSNNILYIASGTNNFVGYGSSADRASLQIFAASISATAPVDGCEAGSANYNPGFTDVADLSLTGSSPARNSGTPIASPAITTDITGASRDANRPNIGAYESLVTQIDQSAPVISNVSITSGSSPVVSCVLTDNSASTNNATIRLWYRLGTSGAYTGLDADSRPSGTMNGTYTWNTSLAALTTGTYNFYIAARDEQGLGVGIWMNPIWAVGFAGFNAADPPNYTANPDANANVRSFQKTSNLAGGTYNVGTGETLLKLTDVANQLNNATLTGDVIYELTSTYDGTTGETFPITFNQFLTDGTNWTVTIRVKLGAGPRTLSGSSTSQLIYLNGVDRLTIDGREDGTGSTKSFTLSNTSTSGTVMTFINDATLNTIKHCTIQGVNTSTSSGTIVFSTTTGTTGNDNNTIDFCDIKDGATKPANGIYSSGTSSKENSGNVISNCNIYNFNGSTSPTGIYISSYTTGWTISGNSFYQTAAYAGAATTAYSIYIGTGNGFIITGNYIGGSASSCGSTAWTINGTAAAFRFVGIYLSVGTTDATSVQGNVIKNFSWLSSSGANAHPGVWCGIYNVAGNINIGNITANTIGETTGTGSVTVNTTTTAGVTFGIANSSTGTINISNNSIGSIAAVGSTTSVSASCIGISITSGTTVTVNNNTIGSASTSNSINASTASTNGSGQQVTGILNSSGATISITNNTIANLNNNYAGTAIAGQIRGIITSSGVNTITANTVRNLSTTSPNTSSTTSAAVLGIAQSSTTAGQTVSQNAVFALSNSATSAAVYCIGIYYNGPTTGTNLVARNNIYNLTLATSSTSASITGIQISGGLATYQNNMVGLGDGLTVGLSITGINDLSGTNSYYFNSVYIGGASVGTSTTPSYAFNSSVTVNTRAFKDNIFFNARSNGTGTGKHYAVKYGGSGANPAGLTADYNDMYVSGTGGVFGYFNSADVASMGAWRTATGQDNNSLYADPVFAAPTGSSPNLHIHATNSTPVEAAGSDIAGITDDFDGQTRAVLTPIDIGADAGDFVGTDIVTPAISYTPLTNTNLTTNRALANTFITDASGINIADGTEPRLYYKKSTNANSLGGTNDNTTDGWKYVEADVSPSPFGFTIDYTLLYNDGAVAPGTVIQYFVVAQDLAATPNVGINSGTFAATPASVALTGSAFPIGGTINSYYILYNISGNYNVGTGQTFTTLTADASTGFFKAVNDGSVSGNFTVTIVSDITEPGTIALNQWTETGTGGYTLTIQPDGTTERILSGTAVTSGNPMISINGADRVTIDGQSGGSGMYLRFRNTNATAGNTGAAIQFTNGSADITLRYCILETNETTTTRGTVTIGATGTNSISVLYCHLRDAIGGTTGAPYCGVYSNSATNTVSLTYNDIFNWTNYGVNLANVANGCNVSNNNFYQTATRTTDLYPINIIGGSSGHTVNTNSIGGAAADRSGTAMTGLSIYGITLTVGITTATEVQGNIISNITTTSTTSGQYLIKGTSGNVNIGNASANLIGEVSKPITVANTLDAIAYSGSNNVSVENNVIRNMAYIASDYERLCGVNVSGGVASIKNNTIRDLSHTGTTNANLLFIPVGISITAATSGNLIEGNQIFNIQQLTANINTMGIYITSVTSLNVLRNYIYNLSSTGTGTGTSSPLIYGIYSASGSATYANNMIALGTGVGNEVRFCGLYDAGTGTNNWYYNSVNISGTTGSGSNNSYAFNRNGTATVLVKNNIFSNIRTGGTGYHVAIANTNAAATGWSATASDYNILQNGTEANIAQWLGSAAGNNKNLAGWQAIQPGGSGGDANTLSGAPGFVSGTDLHINETSSLPSNNATPLIGIVENDFDGTARNAENPDRGADEYTYTAPSVNDPTGVSATAASSSQINVAFTPNENSNNVVIVWNNTGTFDTPTGTPPGIDESFAGGTMLYNGTTSPINHIDLLTNTYYYKLFSYNGTYYSTGVAVNAATPAVVNPTAFTATTVSKSQINLAWTKNAANDSVMVATNSTSTFGTPIAGTAYVATDPITGGGTVIYNGSASGFNHSSLIPSTQYFYKAFSVDAGKNYSAGVTANATTLCDYPTITDTTPGSRCGTGTVTLEATSTGGTITWYAASTGGTALGTGSPWVTPVISATTNFYVDAETVAQMPGVATIGSGTSTSSTSSYTPYCTGWEDGKHQFLVLASELSTAGLAAGDITSLALNVATVGSPAMTSFGVALGQSASVSVLTSTYETGLTTVYSSTSYTPAGTGWQTLTFSTPFVWDGTSNLIVQICYGNNSSWGSSTSIYYSTTSANYHHYGYQDDGTGCAITTPTYNGVNTFRANMQFGGTVQAVCAGPRTEVPATVGDAPELAITDDQSVCGNEITSMTIESTLGNFNTYTWAPVTGLYTDEECTVAYSAMEDAETVYVKLPTAGTYTYTCTGTNTNTGCANQATSDVLVNETPPAPTTTGYSICLGGSIPSGEGLQSTAVGALPTIGSQTIYFTVSAQPVEANAAPGNTVASASMAAIPASATVTSIVLTYNNIEALGSSWQSDVRLGLSGAVVNAAAAGTGTPNTAGVFNYTRTATTGITATLTGGDVNLLYWDNWSDNTGVEATFPEGTAVASLVINYSYPNPLNVRWYRVSTGGSIEGYGSPFDPIGIYPEDSNTPDTYTWYAEVYNGTCASPRTSCDLVIGSTVTTTATSDPVSPVCSGTEVTLMANPSGGGSPYTYEWKVGGNVVKTIQSFDTTLTATTTFNLKVTDICSQEATTSVTVTVNPIPTASASSNSPVCAGQTLNLTGTTDVGTSFSWTGPNGFSSLERNPSITNVTSAAAGTYSFFATANGCTSLAGTCNVVINPSPSAVTITPSSATIDYGDVQQLVASGGSLSGMSILSEDFNGVTNTWTTINNSTDGDDPALAAWTLRPDAYYYGYSTFHSNDNSQFYLSNSDEQGENGITETILQSPSFSTLGVTAAAVNFYHYFNYFSTTSTAKVEASTDGIEWSTLQTYNTDQGFVAAFASASVALTAGFLDQSTVYIRFKYNDEYGYYWAIDNVSVTGTATANITWLPEEGLFTNAGATIPYEGEATTTVYASPEATETYTATATSNLNCTTSEDVTVTVIQCTAPTGLTANSIGTTTANLTWTPTGSETSWEYVYGVAPLAVPTGSGTVTSSSTVNPVSDLLHSTQYQFYARAACPNTNSPWSIAGSFITLCAPVTAFPYEQGFEGTWPPRCWTDESTEDYSWDQSVEGAPHSGSKWAYCNKEGGVLSTPELNLSTASRLVFWFRAEDQDNPQNMDVKIGTDVIYQVSNAMNIDYEIVEVDLSTYTGNVKIDFVGASGIGGDGVKGICLDDVRVATYTNVWTGSISTSWADPGNWNAGVVPGVKDRVVIPTNPTSNRFPAIGNGVTATCYNVVLQTGATIDVQTGGTLNVLHP